MRAGAAWGGVSLLNISSRGALAHAEVSPPKGSYIEIRRGAHVIIAQVVWADHQRFGVRTQDPIGVDAMLADPDGPIGSGQAREPEAADRRAAPRRPALGERHERSRIIARHLEYCCLVGASAVMAGIALSLAKAAIAVPLSQASAVLALH